MRVELNDPSSEVIVFEQVIVNLINPLGSLDLHVEKVVAD